MLEWYRKLRIMRANGWAVAIHNDYWQNGEFKTFWLLTHKSGVWVKGEGATDEIAVLECVRQSQMVIDYTEPTAAP